MPAQSSKRFCNGLTDDDAHILNRVVHVDMKIALGAHFQIDARMLGEGLKHVIKKADAGLDIVIADTIDFDCDKDFRLAGLSFYGRGAHRVAFSFFRPIWEHSKRLRIMKDDQLVQ